MVINIKCPTCDKPGLWTPENTFRPFCSERCKLIDLGAWAAEDHRIPANSATPFTEEQDDDQ